MTLEEKQALAESLREREARSERLQAELRAQQQEAAAKEGRSVNAWLVRAAAAGLQRPDRDRRRDERGTGKRSTQTFTGWVR